MEFVPGVKQKPPSKRTPHEEKSLQGLVHPLVEQNLTSLVAERQLVFGATRQVPGPV